MPEKIGKYQVLERIGRGGMGTIFKAHDPILDRPVALKVISTEIEVTDELRARFFREAQACARLSHPNIVTVYDMGEDDGRLYIVMELLEGEELRHLIAQQQDAFARGQAVHHDAGVRRPALRPPDRGSFTATSSPPTSSCSATGR